MEVKAYQLRLAKEEPFLIRWVKCKLLGKEGKTWNVKKW